MTQQGPESVSDAAGPHGDRRKPIFLLGLVTPVVVVVQAFLPDFWDAVVAIAGLAIILVAFWVWSRRADAAQAQACDRQERFERMAIDLARWQARATKEQAQLDQLAAKLAAEQEGARERERRLQGLSRAITNAYLAAGRPVPDGLDGPENVRLLHAVPPPDEDVEAAG